MQTQLTEFEKMYDVKIICSEEEEPLGTAGPIRLAEKLLTENNDNGLFFVFNSDVICEYPIADMLEFH